MLDTQGNARRWESVHYGFPTQTSEISSAVLSHLARDLSDDGMSYSDKLIKLRAGGESHWYYDGRNAVMQYHPGAMLAKLLLTKLQIFGGDPFTRVAGMGIGGSAFAQSVSWAANVKTIQGNDDKSPGQRYGYGLWGGSVPGQEILVVDDTLTSGSSLITLIDMIRKEDGVVTQAGVVADRSSGIACQRLEKDFGVKVFSLFEFDEPAGMLVPTDF